MDSDGKDGSYRWLLLGFAIAIVLIIIISAAIVFFKATGGNGANRAEYSEIILGPADNGSMSDSQRSLMLGILQSRFSEFGDNVTVMPSSGSGGTGIAVYYKGLRYDEVVSLATARGVFEARIKNDSGYVHVLDNEDIKNVSAPTSSVIPPMEEFETWSVEVNLTAEGANRFRQACIDAGATADPGNHSIRMLIDGNEFYSGPLTRDLAAAIASRPQASLIVMSGTGSSGKATAQKVSAFLHSGILPAGLAVIYSHNQTGQG